MFELERDDAKFLKGRGFGRLLMQEEILLCLLLYFMSKGSMIH